MKTLLRQLWLNVLAIMVCAGFANANARQQEIVTTTPFLVDGVLYVASSSAVLPGGHLRAIDVSETFPMELWDAASRVPLAGSAASQPETAWVGNQSRFLFTGVSGQMVSLSAQQAETMLGVMSLDTVAEAEVFLHTMRGRRGATLDNPTGNRESPHRLGRISRSSPVMVGESLTNPSARKRDRVIYVGAEDGLLHAIYIGRWQAELNHYPTNDPDGGVEIWAYLPGSFLPYLSLETSGEAAVEPAIHVDGSPIVREIFADLDGDGLRRWRTLLVATGTINDLRQSCLFVLDVTDPYQPGILWESVLPGDNVGRARGVSVGPCADQQAECLYLTADFRLTDYSVGLHALSVDLLTGQRQWQFSTTYASSGQVAESTPATPALMDIDQDGYEDSLVFGDLSGQLWILNLEDGHAYGGGPAYTVPGNVDEPIGSAVAVYGDQVVFTTGAVAGSSEQFRYGVYCVKVTGEGSVLRWYYSLEPGEKIWSAPLFDKNGDLILTTAIDYQPLLPVDKQTSGRVLALNKKGELTAEHATDSAIIGQAVSSRGAVITTTLDGGVKQFGSLNRLTEPSAARGSVRVFTWRER